MEEIVYSDEHIILAQFLGVTDLEEISEEGVHEFLYNGDDYEVYSQSDLDDYIAEMISDKITETQREIDRSNWQEDLRIDNAQFTKLEVDEGEIEYTLNSEFGYHMGNYNDEYDEFNGYYIFKK